MSAAVLGLCGAMLSGSACADGRSAALNFFQNLEKAGLNMENVNASNVDMEPTLVKGLYATFGPDGFLIGVINEAGTMMGKASGFRTLDAANGMRDMTPAQLDGLRAEIMANIEYDRLVKLTYGDGGGRKILMFSSLDCPACKEHEQELKAAQASLNATFYLAPSTLQAPDNGGTPLMNKLARIWCSPQPGKAWQAYFENGSVPPARACSFTPRSARREARVLATVMTGVKSMRMAVPMFIAEDGSPIRKNFKVDMTPAIAATLFGPAGKRVPVTPATTWLAPAAVKQ